MLNPRQRMNPNLIYFENALYRQNNRTLRVVGLLDVFQESHRCAFLGSKLQGIGLDSRSLGSTAEGGKEKGW